MELIEGVPLRNFIPLPPRDAGQRLHPVRALAIGIDVACGLAAAHSMGVVHRDVKPENVSLVTDDLAKVIDFGIGKLQPRRGRRPQFSSIPEDRRFSPSCSAPEYLEVPQHCQGPGCVEPPASCSCSCPACARPDFDDPRLDVYSLGILVYNMLTGEHPFRDAQGDAAKMIAAHRERVPLSLASRGFPAYLDDVIDQPNPRRRRAPATAACSCSPARSSTSSAS